MLIPDADGERRRWQPYDVVQPDAPQALLDRARLNGVPYEVRRHEPARHARHLAAIWGVPLPVAGRATLFYAGAPYPQASPHPTAPVAVPPSAPVLVVLPADRKVGAPRLRDLLRAPELRVLRADRGVGRVGWRGLPGSPGALPAVPGLFGAGALVDTRVFQHPRIVLALDDGRSWSLAPADYLRLVGARAVDVAGRTRLLPEGGMVRDPA